MGLAFDHLDRWEEGDYELRRAVSKCFNHTTQLMDVCSSGVLSVIALEGAQKQWDLMQETPVAEEAEEEVTPQASSDDADGYSDLPYRAELYRPLKEDPEMEGVLGLYSEDDDEESDDSEDEDDEESDDE